jgi:G3E family GTPase
MKIHLLSGFLGSGKTTVIEQAARSLIQQGIKTGIVTNDQGTKLVDGGLFKSLEIPNREVVNGCFCCNYNELDASITSLIENNGTEVVFAESVGSCTDIVATVLKPMLQFRPAAQVTVSIFADVRLLQMILKDGASSFDSAVRYIYLKQLEEAGIIVINKIDLISKEQLLTIKDIMQKKYGSKILLYQNSLDADNVQQWLNVLDDYTSAAALQSLNIDYDVYATGEAKLAWVDQVIEIFSSDNNAMQLAQDLVNKMYKEVCEQQYPIGHLKFLINSQIKVSFTSAMEPLVAIKHAPAASATLLINMRVQAAPEILTQLVADAITEITLQSGCTIIVNSQSAFQPGYPRPAYRM